MVIRKKVNTGITTNKILNWSKYILLSGLISCGLSSCQNPENSGKSPSTDYWTRKYSGGVFHDETGYYQDSRIIVQIPIYMWDNEDKKVQNIASAVDAQLSGWNKKENAYLFDVPSSRLNEAIVTLNNIPEVEAYRNYYYISSGYDNEVYLDRAASMDLNSEITAYLSWWHRSINLSKGLDLLAGKTMMLTTIAILDAGFDLTDPEIPFVQTDKFNLNKLTIISPREEDLKLNWNFGDMNSNVQYGKVGYAHGHEVAQFAAGINNGTRANGVAAIGNKVFQLLPIKIVSENEAVQFGLDRINEIKADQFQISQALHHLADIADEVNLGVVNISYGYGRTYYTDNKAIKPGRLVDSAIQRLHDRGVIVVASAGNGSTDACNQIPSSLDNVIAVGGTGLKHKFIFGAIFSNEEKRFFFEAPGIKTNPTAGSNYSDDEKCLTIAAPAQDLLTFPSAGEDYVVGPVPFALGQAGTSFSSPMVAGALALLKARAYPRFRLESYYDAKTYLRQTAKDLVLSGELVHTELNGKVWKTLDVGNLVGYMEGKVPKVDGISEAFHLGAFDKHVITDYGYIVADSQKVFDFNIIPNTIVPRSLFYPIPKPLNFVSRIIGISEGKVAYYTGTNDMGKSTRDYYLTDLRTGKTEQIKQPDKIEPIFSEYVGGKIIWETNDLYLVADKAGNEIYRFNKPLQLFDKDGETYIFGSLEGWKIFRNGKYTDMPKEISNSKDRIIAGDTILFYGETTISRYNVETGVIEKLIDEDGTIIGIDADRDNLLYTKFKDTKPTTRIFNLHTKTPVREMFFGNDTLVIPSYIRGNMLIATWTTDENQKSDLFAYIWK